MAAPAAAAFRAKEHSAAGCGGHSLVVQSGSCRYGAGSGSDLLERWPRLMGALTYPEVALPPGAEIAASQPAVAELLIRQLIHETARRLRFYAMLQAPEETLEVCP
jgi:hypothetical protein